jgi:hypothetical protein
MTIPELYTNTPDKVITRPLCWLQKHVARVDTYEDAVSQPFKYTISLLLHYIIEKQVRFVIPGVEQAYIDFEVVTEEFFEKHKQVGRFRDIDFIATDFTGYGLRYYYQGKAYQKSYPIHLGGELRKKFLERVNSGIKYHTIHDITIDLF